MEKYNNLTLVEFVAPKIRTCGTKRKMAIFRCVCGNESIKAYDAVKCGGIKSCLDCGRAMSNENKKTHGQAKHPLYGKFRDMINRCENKNTDHYPVYGGRGISVCKEWRNDFGAFFRWAIENGYEKHLQIDRKDVDGNYSPENCRFVTPEQQKFNRQNTFYVMVNDKRYCLVEVLYKNGMHRRYSAIWHGIKSGKRSIDYYIKKHGIVFD